MLTTEQKLLAVLCHGGVFLAAPILIPLVVMLITTDEFVKTQAKEALMFQILLIIAGAASGILTILIIGILGLIVVALAAVIFPIIAIVKVLNGNDYTYPISGKWARGI
ncbi:DUF4870 domain-containing protein [Clostridium sp. SYSU_GA19001]|uniref:DUF4870 domain-containing protein n=1 Tax=Clostridium caldaquaticum TaxID=2940653 RepID=UPI0020771DCB|nr:DUF4870 domain-containing protein [Clostridium caldaquaticum]MCM8709765.1 DUF4870 domain-containing protein [Clostridium caldaquaticum]